MKIPKKEEDNFTYFSVNSLFEYQEMGSKILGKSGKRVKKNKFNIR